MDFSQLSLPKSLALDRAVYRVYPAATTAAAHSLTSFASLASHPFPFVPLFSRHAVGSSERTEYVERCPAVVVAVAACLRGCFAFAVLLFLWAHGTNVEHYLWTLPMLHMHSLFASSYCCLFSLAISLEPYVLLPARQSFSTYPTLPRPPLGFLIFLAD